MLFEFLRRFDRPPRPFESLEHLLVSPDGFGLTTATELQIAVCRLIEGRPLEELADHPHVVAAVGDVAAINGRKPRKVVFLAGIRTGKSLLAAALIVWAALTVETRHIGRSEVPRYSTLSTEKDLAKVILNHLLGAVQQSSVLRGVLVGEPTADGCFLRMSTGNLLEAKVVAGARAGRSVVARWAAGFCADEAPRMAGADDAVVNLDDTETAVEGRLLPGAQIFAIGSPWAPFGPVYEAYRAGWGHPTEDLLVIKARADWLNPDWWTPERAARLRRTNAVAYQTDFLAEFADQEATLFTQALLEPCTRAGLTTPPERGHDYVAAMDPATRGNAWTLVVGDRVGQKKRIVHAEQWIGSTIEPLSPRKVLEQIGKVLEKYGLTWCFTDQWAADALRDIADEVGVDLIIEDWTQKGKTIAFTGFRDALGDGSIELPNDPVLLSDLRLVRRRVTQSGISIELPHTGDGRHCDYAPAVVRCLARWIEEDEEAPPVEGSIERVNWDAERRQERAAAALEQQNQKPWWDTYG
jgi:hypothetical protein